MRHHQLRRIRSAVMMWSCLLARDVYAQARPTDGPIAARAANATYLRAYLDTASNWACIGLGAGKDSAAMVGFLRDPVPTAGGTFFVPTEEVLSKTTAFCSNPKLRSGGRVPAAGGVPGLGATLTFGIPSVPTIIVGLSDYFLARAQEEGVSALLAQSKAWFTPGSQLQTLFPSTAGVLATSGATDLSSLVLLIRAASQADFASLPDSLASPRLRTLASPSDSAELLKVAVLSLSARIGLRVSHGEAPLLVLRSFVDLTPQQMPNDEVRTVMRLTGDLAREAAASGGLQRLLDMFGGSTSGSFAAAFVLDDAAQLSVADAIPVSQSNSATRFVKGIGSLTQLALVTKQIQDEIAAANQPGVKSGQAAARTSSANIMLLVSGLIVDVDNMASGVTGRSDATGHEFAAVLGSATALSTAIANKDYHAALASTLELSTSLNVTISPTMLRWANFAASLAAASTSDEVTGALNAFALPENSYFAKRKVDDGASRAVRLYLNGYVGISLGEEWAGARSAMKPFAGAALPIGPEVAFAFAHGTPFSLFFPLIDLGAVASYRIGDSSTDATPNVGFSQVLAPGAYIVWPVVNADWPIDFGFGAQFAPRLRNISGSSTGTTVTTAASNAVRVGLFVAVDVPVFRFR